MMPADKSTGQRTIVRSLLGLPQRDSGHLHGCAAAPPSPFRFSSEEIGEEFPPKQSVEFRPGIPAGTAIGRVPSAPDPVLPADTGGPPHLHAPADKNNAARHIIRTEAKPATGRIAPGDAPPLAAAETNESMPAADTGLQSDPGGNAAADSRHPGAQPRSGRNSSLSQPAPATDMTSPPASRPGADHARPQPFAGATRLTENQGNFRQTDAVAGPAPADHSAKIGRHDGNASFVAMKQSKTVHDAEAERKTVINPATEILPAQPSPPPFPLKEKLTDSEGFPVPPSPHQQERPVDDQVMQLRRSFHASLGKQALVREEKPAKQTAETSRREDEANSPPALQQVVIIKQTTKTNGSGPPAAFWERSYMSHLTLRTIR
ncbi:MAG: hypothetical protein BM485_14640 [Desulfobulbaceae bacterium DB1]|nr:MAG: hypothetical protein BM485_14640 [Desulfobulbaceae bacterium DB1]